MERQVQTLRRACAIVFIVALAFLSTVYAPHQVAQKKGRNAQHGYVSRRSGLHQFSHQRRQSPVSEFRIYDVVAVTTDPITKAGLIVAIERQGSISSAKQILQAFIGALSCCEPDKLKEAYQRADASSAFGEQLYLWRLC